MTDEGGSRRTEEGLEGYKKVTSVDGREEGARRRNEEVSKADWKSVTAGRWKCRRGRQKTK